MKQIQNTLPPPARVVPAKLGLNEKIIKFLEARAIQKRNIESDKLEREIYYDNLERISKPVVQAIKVSAASCAAFQTNKPAIQMQGNNLTVMPLHEQQAHPSLTQASQGTVEAAQVAEMGEELWIQKLYRKFRNSTKCKTTQFEIAEKGVLPGLYAISLPPKVVILKLQIT